MEIFPLKSGLRVYTYAETSDFLRLENSLNRDKVAGTQDWLCLRNPSLTQGNWGVGVEKPVTVKLHRINCVNAVSQQCLFFK